tara:strand:+ start:189 stop:365 length:177 start_codon:yes stop_codon:yes gene_type:complete
MGFKEQIDGLNRSINGFFSFIGGKLKNFPNLSIGEQISYPAIGLGFILILTSIVLFII